jgi:hypothetical protein
MANTNTVRDLLFTGGATSLNGARIIGLIRMCTPPLVGLTFLQLGSSSPSGESLRLTTEELPSICGSTDPNHYTLADGIWLEHYMTSTSKMPLVRQAGSLSSSQCNICSLRVGTSEVLVSPLGTHRAGIWV